MPVAFSWSTRLPAFLTQKYRLTTTASNARQSCATREPHLGAVRPLPGFQAFGVQLRAPHPSERVRRTKHDLRRADKTLKHHEPLRAPDHTLDADRSPASALGDLGAHWLSLVRAWAGQLRTSILFTMVWNRSRDLELNRLGPFIGSKQTSDLPMSEQKEDTMVKKKKAKKAKK